MLTSFTSKINFFSGELFNLILYFSYSVSSSQLRKLLPELDGGLENNSKVRKLIFELHRLDAREITEALPVKLLRYLPNNLFDN